MKSIESEVEYVTILQRIYNLLQIIDTNKYQQTLLAELKRLVELVDEWESRQQII